MATIGRMAWGTVRRGGLGRNRRRLRVTAVAWPPLGTAHEAADTPGEGGACPVESRLLRPSREKRRSARA